MGEKILMDMRMLNLGCGQRLHPDWVNVDFSTRSPRVMEADLRRGVPFADGSFDVVYHSHLLEHFDRDKSQRLLEECHRVLIWGGILRVAVPDLEAIARLYMEKLSAALAGDVEAIADYDWMMLELYDQTVRTRSGGKMKWYLEQSQIPNREFVASRMGWFRESTKRQRGPQPARQRQSPPWIRFLRAETYLERLKRLVLGAEYATLQEARFRHSGEIHAWMYDRFSLARLLRCVGFVDVRRCGAAESDIPGWGSFMLDVEADGVVRKPDSLFMECRKPESNRA